MGVRCLELSPKNPSTCAFPILSPMDWISDYFSPCHRVANWKIGKLENWRKSSGSALLCLLPLVLITGETAYSQCRVQLQLNRPDINTSASVTTLYAVPGQTRVAGGVLMPSTALHWIFPPVTWLQYPLRYTGLQVLRLLCPLSQDCTTRHRVAGLLNPVFHQHATEF